MIDLKGKSLTELMNLYAILAHKYLSSLWLVGDPIIVQDKDRLVEELAQIEQRALELGCEWE
jgi:hypothetical protein